MKASKLIIKIQQQLYILVSNYQGITDLILPCYRVFPGNNTIRSSIFLIVRELFARTSAALHEYYDFIIIQICFIASIGDFYLNIK